MGQLRIPWNNGTLTMALTRLAGQRYSKDKHSSHYITGTQVIPAPTPLVNATHSRRHRKSSSMYAGQSLMHVTAAMAIPSYASEWKENGRKKAFVLFSLYSRVNKINII